MGLKDRFETGAKKVKAKFHRHVGTASVSQPTTPSIGTSYQSVGRDSAENVPNVPTITATNRDILPSLHDATHQTPQPSTESRLVDQGQPEPPNELAESSGPALSVSEELWNTAYNKVSEDDGQLVESYLKILQEVLGGENSDQTEHYEYMRELVKRGRERIEKASKITSKLGSISDYILSSRGIVDLTIKAVPQAAPAALPWAGVCLALDILRNPSQEMNSNLEGITYVISRMDWYCALTELLLNKSNFADGNIFREVLTQLKEMIIELYEALLLFQMKSIVSYYSHQGVRFLRDMAKLDDWKGGYQHVKDVEASVRTAVDQYYKEQTKVRLENLSENASSLIALLGNIQQDIRAFISEQQAASRDKDDSECRRDLRVVDPQDDMTRIENNKDPLLDDVYKWIFERPEYKSFANWEPNSPQCRILWLKGHAGTGKTMLMIGIIRTLSNLPVVLAPGVSFFFLQNTVSELRTATAVLRSLIWLLLLQQPYLISHLLPRYKISGPSLFTDSNSFIALSEVFKNMLRDDRLSPIYLAVDALDECSEGEGRADLINLISDTFTLSKNVKWLLSSRPEVDIYSEIKTADTLIELNTESLEDPVKAYIQHKLKYLEGKRGYGNGVLEEISKTVYEKADNTFLWVALAFKALGKKNGKYAVETLSKMPSGLSELYGHMMERIDKSSKLEPSDCKKILKAVFLAFRPLSVAELSTLTGLEEDITLDAVEECGSFVIVTNQIVNLIHQSAKDYLNDKYNPKGDPDWVGLQHWNLIEHTIDALSTLKWNIYRLELDTKTKDISLPVPDPLAALRYPCLFWVAHLTASKREQPSSFRDVMTSAYKFLKTVFLRWVEILSLLGNVEDGIRALGEVVRLTEIEPNMDSNIIEFSKDAYMFLSRNVSIIPWVPLQTYSSALIFAPTFSLVREQYWGERQPLVERKRGFKNHWEHHQTLHGHRFGGSVAIAFSPDNTIAVCSSRDEMWLYDATTGAHRQTINIGSSFIAGPLAFTPNGKTLAICVWGEGDNIRLFDMATGLCRLTFGNDTRGIIALAFSPNGNMLASIPHKGALQLWHLESDKIYPETLKGHTDKVLAIAFAPNGTLVSGSGDGTIGLWDLVTGLRTQTIEPQGGPVLAIAVSPDGHTIASGDLGGNLSLWKVADRTRIILSCNGRQGSVQSIAFSPDGKALASARKGHMAVEHWDLTSNPPSCEKLDGHTDDVRVVAFSPNGKTLASASIRGIVHLWDMTATSASSEMSKEQTMGVAISPSGEILAEVSRCGSLRLWDLATIQLGSKPVGEYVFDFPLEEDGNQPRLFDCTFSTNGRMLALAWTTGVHIWDLTTTPKISSTLQVKHAGHLKFSPDSKFLAVDSFYSGIQVWNLRTTSLEGTAPQTRHSSFTIAFTPDSTKFVAFEHDTYWVWDQTIAKKQPNGAIMERVNGVVISEDVQLSDAIIEERKNRDVMYKVDRRDAWIEIKGKRLVWMPVEYRVSWLQRPAIYGATIAVPTVAESLLVIEIFACAQAVKEADQRTI